jgi:hypothetical protein
VPDPEDPIGRIAEQVGFSSVVRVDRERDDAPQGVRAARIGLDIRNPFATQLAIARGTKDRRRRTHESMNLPSLHPERQTRSGDS